MTENWKDKTCELCFFRLYSHCHRFPPSAENSDYPLIEHHDNTACPAIYTAACAEYKEADNE